MAALPVPLKIARNLLVAILSSVWILPVYLAIDNGLNFVRWYAMEMIRSGTYKNVPYIHIEFFEIFSTLALGMLGAGLFFWSFVAAGRIWPILKNR